MHLIQACYMYYDMHHGMFNNLCTVIFSKYLIIIINVIPTFSLIVFSVSEEKLIIFRSDLDHLVY